MIRIDDDVFNVGIVSVTRKASQKKELIGTTLDLRKHYDVEGTYYDYEVTFNVKGMNSNEYSRLYEKLTTPVEYYEVEMPYNQTTITFKANLSVGSDTLIYNYKNAKKWSSLKVIFEALEPQKVVLE